MHELERFADCIEGAIYTTLQPLEIECYRTREPLPFSERLQGEKMECQVGQSWGKLFDCAWFHFTGNIPEVPENQSIVILLDINGEMLVVDKAGNPLRGLTNVSSTFDRSLGKPGKHVIELHELKSSSNDTAVDFWADAGCNDLFGEVKENAIIKQACFASCNNQMLQIFYDYEVLFDLYKVLPNDNIWKRKVFGILEQAINAWYRNDFTTIQEIFKNFFALRSGDTALTISAIGHSHLDLAWLWPIRETIRKGARTFATALANLKKYPEYKFGASQPQLFDWMKIHYPDLYKRIKEAVKNRRIELQGAMWVEADTNICGGESLIRQILYGNKFYMDEFGQTIDNIWLPDVFGYSGNLPQIFKKSGMKYFMTQKMSWSAVNKFPYHSFRWKGIDNSEILTHMLPESNYNSPALPKSVDKIERNYNEADVSSTSLILFGVGDGGGGPGEEHLERLKRIKNLPMLSKVNIEFAQNFFENWSKEQEKFPTWKGELYLEKHQGTLTSNSRNKWFNRKLEFALRELEFLSSLAAILTDYAYPDSEIEAIWKEVLLYQFHDIIPGSSIKRVYDESCERYETLLAKVNELISLAMSKIVSHIGAAQDTKKIVVFNSLSWERDVCVEHEGKLLKTRVPALGYTTITTDSNIYQPNDSLVVKDTLLENEFVKVTFNSDGSILSIYDKILCKEALNGSGNLFHVYHDVGDAWDFSSHYQERLLGMMRLVSVKSYISGHEAIIEQHYSFGNSTLVCFITLSSLSKGVKFRCKLDWKDTNTMLRVLFPTTILSDRATYDIQFGFIERTTTDNTSWDAAQIEVAAQKWADISQSDFGVALLNDSKYGYSIKENVINLGLHRSVRYPGPSVGKVENGYDYNYSDQGEFVFTYAIYTHANTPGKLDVQKKAYELNVETHYAKAAQSKGKLPENFSLCNHTGESVLVDTVKQTENKDGFLMRLYEAGKSSVKSTLNFTVPIQKIVETNLVEIDIQELPDNTLQFNPFEIKSIRFNPDRKW